MIIISWMVKKFVFKFELNFILLLSLFINERRKKESEVDHFISRINVHKLPRTMNKNIYIYTHRVEKRGGTVTNARIIRFNWFLCPRVSITRVLFRNDKGERERKNGKHARKNNKEKWSEKREREWNISDESQRTSIAGMFCFSRDIKPELLVSTVLLAYRTQFTSTPRGTVNKRLTLWVTFSRMLAP